MEIDWEATGQLFAVLGGLSGYAALGWTVWRDARAGRAASDARLSVLPKGTGDLIYLKIQYIAEQAGEALIARIEVLSPVLAGISDDPNSAMIYDPATSMARPNPSFQTKRLVDVKLHPDHSDPLQFSRTLAATGASSGMTLKVTVSTWPTAKRLIQKTRKVSTHA